MARIDIPEPQLQVPVVELPPVGSGTAQALGQAKQAFQAEAAAWEDRQTQNGRVDAARSAAEIQQRYTDLVLRKKANGELKTEDDVTALDDAFQADATDATNNASSYAKDPLTLALISTQRSMHEDALGAMLDQQVADRYAGVSDTIRTGIQTVATDPTKFPIVYPQLRALLDGYKAPAAQKAATEKMLSGLGAAAILKMVEVDPDAAHKILDGGAAEFHIDPTELPGLRTKVREAETRVQLSALLQQQVGLNQYANGQSEIAPVITPEIAKRLGEDNAARLQIQIDDVNAAREKAALAATRDIAAVKTIVEAGHTPDYSQEPMKRGLNLTYAAAPQPATVQEKDRQDMAFVQTYGGVPQQVESEISGGLHSQNQQEVLHAAKKYGMLEQADGRYVSGFREDEKTLANTLDSQIRAGVDENTAFENWRKYQSMTKDEKEARASTFRELTRDQDPTQSILDAVGGNRDWSGWLWGQEYGNEVAATVPRDAVNAFKKVQENMYVVSGDEKAAAIGAATAVKRGWGISMMRGEPQVTAFAPERFYGSPKLSVSQNFSWIHDQAIDDMKKMGVVIPPDAMLVMTPSARRTPDGKPTYILGLQYPDGSKVDINPTLGLAEHAFVPDITLTHTGKEVDKKAADQSAADRAAAARKTQMLQWQYGRGIDLHALREDAQKRGFAPKPPGPQSQPEPQAQQLRTLSPSESGAGEVMNDESADEPASQIAAPTRAAAPTVEPAAPPAAAPPPATPAAPQKPGEFMPRLADVESGKVLPPADNRPAEPPPALKHFNEARAQMKLSPQEQGLYQHHLKNLYVSGAVKKGSETSTVKQITVEIDGRTYNIPTVWDGKILSAAEAVKRAKAAGLENWPSYKTRAEAQARYDEMHKYIERDVKEMK